MEIAPVDSMQLRVAAQKLCKEVYSQSAASAKKLKRQDVACDSEPLFLYCSRSCPLAA